MAAVFTNLALRGLLLIEPRVSEDERGFFMETYKESEYRLHGIGHGFLQDNHSRSSKGVLRGLHFQRDPHAQAKLVRVVRGSVWDVAVDLRRDSSSYKRWYGLELSAANHNMLYVPKGFAHGFLALEDGTELVYKCSCEYDKESEGGVRWDDRELSIAWPLKEVLVSEKDRGLPALGDMR